MYLAIDLDNMRFAHKHADFNVCANLAWITMHSRAYTVFKMDDAHGLKDFTLMELKMLYHNSTSEDWSHYDRKALLQTLWDLFTATPQPSVNAREVEVQASTIKEADESLYLYAKGSMVPVVQLTLFPSLTGPRNPLAEAAAIAGNLPALAAPPRPKTKPSGAVSKLIIKSGPKRGTAKQVIHDEANKAWEVIGKPQDVKLIGAMRKELMTVLLDEHGIAKTSSSSELGQWQKLILVK